jgi:hypothetical protein
MVAGSAESDRYLYALINPGIGPVLRHTDRGENSTMPVGRDRPGKETTGGPQFRDGSGTWLGRRFV